MKMSLTNGLLRSVLLCVPLAAVASPPTWPEATQESKPWVYNWWMGSAVDEKGLEAQCAALAEKGFGGFHVIPIYGAKGFENQYRKFLSPEWMKAFASAVRIGAAHGLGVDLTTGSGWCFGGPQIDATNGCWKLQRRLDGMPPYVEPVLTGQFVKRAGPGGEGPMMDPYSSEAMASTFSFVVSPGSRIRLPSVTFSPRVKSWSDEMFSVALPAL